MRECPICFILFEDTVDVAHIENHVENCLEQQNLINLQTQNMTPFTPLTPLTPLTPIELSDVQKKAFKFCLKKSKIHSKSTFGNVLIRFIELGYTEEDLNLVVDYIKNDVNVTINCREETLINHIIGDNLYRNGFEVHKIYCALTGAREQWEKNLFNSIYDNCQPKERVKYGALNLFNNPNGLTQCTGYGKFFFVLKKHVKDRISFVNGDSSGMMFHICTFKWNSAILIHMNDALLKNLIDHVKGKKECHKAYNQNYVEAQIHGDLRLDTDIEKLVVNINKSNINFPIIKNFCDKNNIILEFLK